MRTLIRSQWIVGNDGRGHTLLRDGVLVFERERILHVGASFEGHVDHVIDAGEKLVCPGFIDTHVHSGHRASHRLISDAGRPLYFGQPFLEISVPKQGRAVAGDPRYLPHGAAGLDATLELNALFTVVELLRNGVTTFAPISGPATIAAAGSAMRKAGSSAFATRSPDSAASRSRSISSAATTAIAKAVSAACWFRARWKPRRSVCWSRRWPAPTS